MRIDDLDRTPLTQRTKKTDQAAEQRAPRKDCAATADRAEVSELAQTLASHDPQRLDKLRLEVQSGKYKVSAEAVAKAIIDAHRKE